MGFKLKNGGYIIEEFEKNGVKAGYGKKDFTLSDLKKYAEKNKKILVSGIQTHSSNIVIIKKDDSEEKNIKNIFEDTDGFITNREDIILYTKHADCQGIYFYDTKEKVIGLCHSGWKGTFKEIGLEMLKGFKTNFNSKIENLIVGVGIGISVVNYEVSGDFLEEFKTKFDISIIEKSFINKSGKIFFNNEKFIIEMLKKYGIKEENIFGSQECTYNNIDLHSYRRDKEKSGRNLAFIEIETTNN